MHLYDWLPARKSRYRPEWLKSHFLKSCDLKTFLKKLKTFGEIIKGKVATGDQFISDNKKLIQLKEEILNLDAVEMEGAAFAQVCYQEDIKWSIVRVISDKADGSAGNDFPIFLEKYKLIYNIKIHNHFYGHCNSVQPWRYLARPLHHKLIQIFSLRLEWSKKRIEVYIPRT